MPYENRKVASLWMVWNELKKWEHVAERLRNEMRGMRGEQRKQKKQELKRARMQISYYRALLREMKLRIHPPKIIHFLNVLRPP